MAELTETWFSADRLPLPATGGELARRLSARVEEIANSPAETARRARLAANLSLYCGSTVNVGDLFVGSLGSALEQGSAFNLVYSLVNTIRNRICSFRPRGQFLPNGGDRRASKGARDKTAMCDAWMQQQKWWDHASLAERDSLTGDGGIVKYYREGNGEHEAVYAGRFPPWEFLVDQGESLYGEPECIYHVHLRPLGQAARYYEVAESTLAAASVNLTSYGTFSSEYPMTLVVDAYQRGPEGRHVVMVGDTVVVDEPWEHDGFPLSKKLFDESETGYGYWGIGAITMLRPIQEEIGDWETAMREAHRMSSMQVWVLPEGAEPTNVTNDYVRIARTRPGDPPIQVINPEAASAEAYKWGDRLEQQAYKLLGISQFIASGVKQPGVTSKVAIRETSELQSDRLALESQRYEAMAVDASEWWWKLTRDMCRENPAAKPKWRAIDRGAWRELVFGDLDAEWEIRSYPTSIFGQGVSGRLDKADDAIQRGWLSREDAMRSLDVPDLSPVFDLQLSEQYVMESIVDGILEEGKYITPDPYLADPLKLNAYAAARYRLAVANEIDYPRQNLALLRRLIRATKPKPQPAAAPPAPPAQGAPPPPAPPPVPGVPAAPAPVIPQ